MQIAMCVSEVETWPSAVWVTGLLATLDGGMIRLFLGLASSISSASGRVTLKKHLHNTQSEEHFSVKAF